MLLAACCLIDVFSHIFIHLYTLLVLVCNPHLFSLNRFLTFETAVFYCCFYLEIPYFPFLFLQCWLLLCWWFFSTSLFNHMFIVRSALQYPKEQMKEMSSTILVLFCYFSSNPTCIENKYPIVNVTVIWIKLES